MSLKESIKALAHDIKWVCLMFALSFLATGMIIGLRDGNGDMARFCILFAIACVSISLACSMVKD